MEELDPESIKSPQDILDFIAKTYESDPAVSYGGNVWSYKQLWDMVNSLSTSMRENFGMKKGQRVLLVLPPSIQMVLSYFSLWRNGVSAIPLDIKTPLSLMDKIASSGKISGIITYDSLFSHINRNDTSNIYNILTGAEEFRGILSGKNPDMENLKIKGTRQRAVFEEMCYSEWKESEHIDPFTDIALSEIQWRKDSSFGFLNFIHRKFTASIRESAKIFQARKNQPFLVTKEPTSLMEIICEMILPIMNGQKLVMIEDIKKNLEKNINSNGLEDNVIIWAGRNTMDLMRSIKGKTLPRISIILSNYAWNEDEISFLEKRKSSLISLEGYEGVGIPIMQRQFIAGQKAQGNFLMETEEGNGPVLRIPPDFVCDRYESDTGYYTIDKIERDSMKLIDQNNELLYLHRGRSIPIKGLSEYLEENYKIHNCSFAQDPLDWRLLDLSFSPKGAKIEIEKFNKSGPGFLTPLKIVE